MQHILFAKFSIDTQCFLIILIRKNCEISLASVDKFY